MKTMDEDAFKAYFGDELMWTTMLSNGSVVHLKPGHDDGAISQHVQFADRQHYISLVKQARMSESQQQVLILHLYLSNNSKLYCVMNCCYKADILTPNAHIAQSY